MACRGGLPAFVCVYSALLQWAAAEDILTLHEGSGGALSITAVNRTHSVFRAVRLANPDALKAWLEADALAATGGAEGGGSGVAGANNSKLEIIIQDKVWYACVVMPCMPANAVSCPTS